MPGITPKIVSDLEKSIQSLTDLKNNLEQLSCGINQVLLIEITYLLNRLKTPQILWFDSDGDESERQEIYRYAFEQSILNKLQVEEELNAVHG